MRRIRYETYRDCKRAKQIVDKTDFKIASRCEGCELYIDGKDANKAVDYLFFDIRKPQPKCCC